MENDSVNDRRTPEKGFEQESDAPEQLRIDAIEVQSSSVDAKDPIS